MPHDPLSLPSTTATSPLPLPLRNNIYSALMSQSTSTGGIPAIQALLTHELQASGWITELRAYVTTLLRSGECTSEWSHEWKWSGQWGFDA
ncbi:hypothetical protein BCR34DRAFT_60693 [Clohesyomyces aquaticus]|uniref:Uncharacterized protein n=1 Tax=Clohesyomyces aquaticus TaxID=1231657 RepID=A0A1Y2A464_9PLEO|nr:hypothetical protein BCR34DRAFT_60693 [Clohesyomyces aquaticus]